MIAKICVVLALALAATPTFAHHSMSMFDRDKTIEVKGTVKEFHWTNPHSWVVIEVSDAAGKLVEWSFEANGPGYLVRNGWKRESLKPGDKVVVKASPLRDGSAGGNIKTVVLSSGQELSAQIVPRTPAAAPQNTTGAQP
jgi:hypothetical protein